MHSVKMRFLIYKLVYKAFAVLPKCRSCPYFSTRYFALVITNCVLLIFVQSTKSTLTPLTPTVLAKSYPIQPIIQL